MRVGGGGGGVQPIHGGGWVGGNWMQVCAYGWAGAEMGVSAGLGVSVYGWGTDCMDGRVGNWVCMDRRVGN